MRLSPAATIPSTLHSPPSTGNRKHKTKLHAASVCSVKDNAKIWLHPAPPQKNHSSSPPGDRKKKEQNTKFPHPLLELQKQKHESPAPVGGMNPLVTRSFRKHNPTPTCPSRREEVGRQLTSRFRAPPGLTTSPLPPDSPQRRSSSHQATRSKSPNSIIIRRILFSLTLFVCLSGTEEKQASKKKKKTTKTSDHRNRRRTEGRKEGSAR